MKPQAILQQLEAAAEQLSVKVSYEVLGATVGHGGLCRVKGQYRVIIDKRASIPERVATLARALSQLEEATTTALSPALRQLIASYSYRRRAFRPAS